MSKSVRLIAAIAAPVVVIGAAVAVPSIANAATDLPDKSASQVLALMAKAKDQGFSGTVEQKAELGLPALPSGATGGAQSGSPQSSYAGILDLLGGSHTVRVYADGATKQRVQVLDQLAERDVIRNGRTVWTWDSKKNVATKTTLPEKGSDASAAPSGATTPSELATRLVDRLKGSTTFSVDRDASVAGRSAYQLTLTPKTDATLVKDVTLAVDAKTGVPLKVAVEARGQKTPAFSVAFTKIDLSTPDAKTFDFTAPKGATVTEKTAPTRGSGTPFAHSAPGSGGTVQKPQVVGTGWDAVAVIPAATAARGAAAGKDSGLLDQLTTPVAGGRAIQTSLVSVLMLDDGRVLVGAVPVSALQAAAG